MRTFAHLVFVIAAVIVGLSPYSRAEILAGTSNIGHVRLISSLNNSPSCVAVALGPAQLAPHSLIRARELCSRLVPRDHTFLPLAQVEIRRDPSSVGMLTARRRFPDQPPPPPLYPPPPPPPSYPPPPPDHASSALDFYLFVVPGGATGPNTTDGTLQAGVGVENVWTNGFGFGVEASALGVTRDYFGPATIAVLSPNLYFHFRPRGVVDPFITGGYSAFIRDRLDNLLNLGAGLNFWLRPRFGLRLAFRDYVNPSRQNQPLAQSTPTSLGLNSSNYWGIQLGLIF